MTSPPASKTTATLATARPGRRRRFCARHHCYSSPIPTGGLRHEVQELLVNTFAGNLIDETDTPIPRPRDGVDDQSNRTTRTAHDQRRPAMAF